MPWGGLWAAQNQIAAVPAGVAGRLPRLHTLSLRQNRLAALPEDLAALTALANLDAAGNRLAALPAGLAGMRALRRLCLEDNELAALEPRLGLLPLTALSVAGNPLRLVPPARPPAPAPAPAYARVHARVWRRCKRAPGRYWAATGSLG